MTGTEHDEALAREVLPALHRERDRQGWNSPQTLGGAVRAAGWLPLTEVEEALRAKAEERVRILRCDDAHAHCLRAAADLVASLGRKP